MRKPLFITNFIAVFVPFQFSLFFVYYCDCCCCCYSVCLEFSILLYYAETRPEIVPIFVSETKIKTQIVKRNIPPFRPVHTLWKCCDGTIYMYNIYIMLLLLLHFPFCVSFLMYYCRENEVGIKAFMQKCSLSKFCFIYHLCMWKTWEAYRTECITIWKRSMFLHLH